MNVVNLTLFVGQRLRGSAGVVVAMLAFLLPPMVLIVILAGIYDRVGDIPWVHQALGGMAAAAAGLTVSMGVKAGQGLRRRPRLADRPACDLPCGRRAALADDPGRPLPGASQRAAGLAGLGAMSNGSWWLLIVVFAPLSLLSIGGGQSIVADMDQQVVHVYGWLTQTEFIDLFAISRAAPGPGSLLVTLIGWKVAGIPGALIASAAMFLPSSVLAYVVTRLWNRHRGRRWHSALELGLPPIASALVLAGAFTVLRASPEGAAAWIIAALATAMLLLCRNGTRCWC